MHRAGERRWHFLLVHSNYCDTGHTGGAQTGANTIVGANGGGDLGAEPLPSICNPCSARPRSSVWVPGSEIWALGRLSSALQGSIALFYHSTRRFVTPRTNSREAESPVRRAEDEHRERRGLVTSSINPLPVSDRMHAATITYIVFLFYASRWKGPEGSDLR